MSKEGTTKLSSDAGSLSSGRDLQSGRGGQPSPPPTCFSSTRCIRRAAAATISRPFMTQFRKSFPDLKFWGAADLIAEGDSVVGRWEGGGTHTGPAFTDCLVGSLPPATGRKMHFTGTTVLRVRNGKIAEEVGLDDGVTALTQLGLLKAA
jgi:predicted ester cyclase